MTAATQTSEVEKQASVPATEAPWPRPDFAAAVMRLRADLESAVRVEKSKAQEIAGLQDLSFTRGIPASVLAGGQDRLEKLGNKQDAAQVAVQRARDALRKFVDDERAIFFTRKDDARRRLNTEITAQFERAKAAASELIARLQERLGAASEIADEEQRIRVWNRVAKRLNSSIPVENVTGIPGIALIDSGESFRTTIAQMLLGDPQLRELVRGILERDNEQRRSAESRREFAEQQAIEGTIHDDSPFASKV